MLLTGSFSSQILTNGQVGIQLVPFFFFFFGRTQIQLFGGLCREDLRE